MTAYYNENNLFCADPAASLTFGSVCSGIEAASVAWEPFGWRACWFAEVDKAASDVLNHRFPTVPNYGDMTLLAGMVRRREIPAPDVLVGGTPCQAFSVAGMRKGLADSRGQLTLAFVDLADAIDEIRAEDGLPPVIIVWENVPGVLTSKDNAFGCFLAGLAGDDEAIEPGPRPESGRSSAHWRWDKKSGQHRSSWTYAGAVAGPERAIAWIIKDAQYFGLAQRRRRVFVVAGAGDGFDPAAILLEFEGVRRDSAPSRDAGEGVAGTLDARTDGGGFPGTDGACSGHDVPAALQRLDAVGSDSRVAPTLDASYARLQGCSGQDMNHGHGHLVPVAFGGNNTSGPIDVATARNAHAGPHGRLDFESETFVVDLAPASLIAFDPRGTDVLIHGADRVGALDTKFPGPAICFNSKAHGGDATEEMSPTLRASGSTVGHDNGGRTPAVVYPEPIPFDTTQITSPGNYIRPQAGDPCHPLAAGAHPPAVCVTEPVTHTLKAEGFDASEDGTGRGQPIVAAELYSIMPMNSGKEYKARVVDVAQPLMAGGPVGGNQGGDYILEPTMAVRRLMPVECERLQGFPDNWTLVPTGKHGKLASDGPRYKQCGNSMATNVMHWIGRRIAAWLNKQRPTIEDMLG